MSSAWAAVEVGAPAAAAAGLEPWAQMLIAAGLLVLAASLLLVEFFVISWGLLSVCAAAAAYAACTLAFAVSPAYGWAFVAACPLGAILIIPWGLKRMQRSRAVPKVEITENAGYRHHTDALGIAPGSIGELVTDALPTGRARFPGGEIDVAVEGNGLTRGTRVVVLRIEGPIVTVRLA